MPNGIFNNSSIFNNNYIYIVDYFTMIKENNIDTYINNLNISLKIHKKTIMETE